MLAIQDDRLPITRSAIDDVLQEGRFEKSQLVEVIEERLAAEEINEEIVKREARKRIAQEFVSAWANQATIKLDRKQRVPVFQADLGFAGSFFKVGSEFVAPEAMTAADFEVMLERFDRRIENAQTDRTILADFYDRARPGLEAGQNLVEQFEAGTLELFGVNGTDAIEAGDEDEEASEA